MLPHLPCQPNMRPQRLFALSVAIGALITCSLGLLLILRGSDSSSYRLAGVPDAAAAGTTDAAASVASVWRPVFSHSELQPQPVRQLMPYITDACTGRAPCISFGTPLWHRWRMWLQELDAWQGGGQAACGVPCDLVSDPGAADAVLFHGRDLEPRPGLVRHPGQRWVYVNQESPIATKRYGYDVASDPKFRHLFNWTATPLLSGAIHFPYGSWERRQKPLDDAGRTADLSAKKKFMAFVAFSNCKNSFNNRTAKVAELQKYMEVHVYGDCGDRKLAKNQTLFQQLSEQYRFYLSFENAFCRDYITEKFHTNGLDSHAVPVAFGGLSRGDYERVSPPHSFVYALDFASIKHLADYLIALAADEVRYAEFFQWKRHFRPSGKATMLCAVCTKLHSDRKVSVSDLSDYYDIRSNCRPPDYQYLL